MPSKDSLIIRNCTFPRSKILIQYTAAGSFCCGCILLPSEEFPVVRKLLPAVL